MEYRVPPAPLPLLAVSLLLVAATACVVGGPDLPEAQAASAIGEWLPAVDVSVLSVEGDGDDALVRANVSGEPLRFRFRPTGQGAWELAGMVTEDGEVVGRAATRDAWLEILRSPRRITLDELAAGRRPAAPLEVVVTPLRVADLAAGRMELAPPDDPGQVVVVRGRHFDELPLGQGDDVALQVQDLAREEGHWVPVRRQLPGDLMVELEPMDVTLLALLKLRVGERVIPVPYDVPDMAHEHGG